MNNNNHSTHTNAFEPSAAPPSKPPRSSKKPTTRELIDEMEERLTRYINEMEQRTAWRIEQLNTPTAKTTEEMEERLSRYLNEMEQRTAWRIEQLNHKLANTEQIEERLMGYLYWLQNRLQANDNKIQALRSDRHTQVARRNILLVLAAIFAAVFYLVILRPRSQPQPPVTPPPQQNVVPQPQSFSNPLSISLGSLSKNKWRSPSNFSLKQQVAISRHY